MRPGVKGARVTVLTSVSLKRSTLTADVVTHAEGSPMSWYYCLEHQRVEPAEGCPNRERLGPYPTEAEAQHALELAAERSAAFDAQDEDDD